MMLIFAHLGLALAAARLAARGNLVFVAAGSMLPDIIDKPLGEILYGTPNMGRIFAHTFLLLLLLGAIACYTRDVRAASLFGGVLAHLILDFMWLSPGVLLWPLLGGFPAAEPLDAAGYLQMLLSGLAKPAILLPETMGLAYIIYLIAEEREEIFSWTKKTILRVRSRCESAFRMSP
jgi:membrane-bound metal-dependent hydrolase YbcI (DUF457 family)